MVNYGYGVDDITLMPSEFRMQLSAEATYFLVGCLGGLGRRLTTWKVDRVARHFVFLSCSSV